MAIQIVRDEERLVYEAEGSKIFYRRISTLRRGGIVRKHTKRGKTDWNAVTKELLEYVVLGWENVERAGKPVPYSPELVMLLPEEVLSDLLELCGANIGTESEEPEKN